MCINEFQSAKKDKLVLPDYAVATGAQDEKDYRPAQGKPVSRPTAVSGSNSPVGVAAKPAETPLEEQSQQWAGVTLTWIKGSQTLKATAPQKVPAEAKLAAAKILMDMLPPEQRARLEKKGELKGAQATVTLKGNACTLKTLAWPTSS